MAYVEEVMNEYKNSLRDLNFNSKPLINMLTMLAEENEQHAPCIVKVIEDEIIKAKSNRKLPILYLIDSIIKNLPKTSYKSLFTKNLVHVFTTVFEQVDEKIRASMYKLRQTWAPLFPNAKLYSIDVKIKSNLDPAWPITATPPEQTSIHVNPNFLKKSETETSPEPEPQMSPEPTPDDSPKEEDSLEAQESLMRQQLIAKQQELLKLQQARLELELAEAKEKLNKQKKKNAKLSIEEQELPDTTVPPTSLESLPAPRDPRTAGRDPRLKGSSFPTQSGLPAHSTMPSGLPMPPEGAFMPATSLSGPQTMPPFSGSGVLGSLPPFPQSGQLHVNPGFLSGHLPLPTPEGHFKGEVYHPDSSDDVEIKSPDSRHGSNKTKVQHKEPTINIRDPRQAKREAELHSKNTEKVSDNRNKRDGERNSRGSVVNKKSNSVRDSNKNIIDQGRDQRRSRSPHSSSRSPRSSESGRELGESKSRDPRLKQHSDDNSRDSAKSDDFHSRYQDDRIGPNVHGSPNKHKSSPSSRDNKRHSRDKSPERSPKYSKRSDRPDIKSGKDRRDRVDDRTKNQTDKKGSSKERSLSPSKDKVRIKSDHASKAGSVERTDKGGKEEKARTPKRELEKDDLAPVGDESESLSKKARIEPVDEKPKIIEGADLLGKIQEDIRTSTDSDFSELFGGEDQDYRPTDAKGLPLKSPSCKGWDKFKADHPDQYAYDIELKRQRSESMEVDQKQFSEPQDTDYRLQHQGSWSEQSISETRREPAEEVPIPLELSMEHHAEIIIQAHKQLQEGRLTHEQHQLLLQELGKLMTLQKQQEMEQNRRLSLEAEKVQQKRASLEGGVENISPIRPEIPVDRDLRQPSPMTPEDNQRIPPNMNATPPGPPVNRPFVPGVGKMPTERPGNERFQMESSPHKQPNKGVPEFERPGPLHNLYPEVPRGPPDERRPPFPPHPNLPPDRPDFNGPRPRPSAHDGDFRRPDEYIPHERPPSDERDIDDRGPGRGQSQPDFREHPPEGHRGPLLDTPPMMPPPQPFFMKEENNSFEGRRKDAGPFDRGDFHQNDFRHGQRKDMGPPPPHALGPEGFDNIPPEIRDFEERHGHSDRMVIRPEGQQDMRNMGPPRQGNDLPQERDHNHGRRDHVPENSMDREFPDRREAPSGRSWGHQDGFRDGPPEPMGPSDMRNHGPFNDMIPDRMDLNDDRNHRIGGSPGGQGFGPPDVGPSGEMGHGTPDWDFDRREGPTPGRRGRGFGHSGMMEMGQPDREGPGRRDWREQGPPDRGFPDREHEPLGNWREHGPDRPYDGRNFGPPDRRENIPPEMRGMGPDRRDFERRDGHPDRFHENREYGSPEKMGIRRPGYDEGEPVDRMGYDRREPRLPYRRENEGRFESPPDRRDWGPHGERRGWEWQDRPQGPEQMDHANQRDGLPNWNNRSPGWRDRASVPERLGGLLERKHEGRDRPEERTDRRIDRDEKRLSHGEKLEEEREKFQFGESNTEKGPNWPLGGRQQPFNPNMHVADVERMVSERQTPPVDGQREAQHIDSADDRTPAHVSVNEERQDSTGKGADKHKQREEVSAHKPEETKSKGKRNPLLPTPPAHLRKPDSEELKSETSADSSKDKKLHIPALLELSVKPTKDLSVKEMDEDSELSESKEEMKEDTKELDPKTGLGPWKSVAESDKPDSRADEKTKKKDVKKGETDKHDKKAKKKPIDNVSDEESDPRKNSPFLLGAFLQGMRPQPKDKKKPPSRSEKKPSEREEKKLQGKKDRRERDGRKPYNRDEKVQDKNERRTQDRDDRKPRGRDERHPPDREGRNEKPDGRDERRHGREEMGPPGHEERRPLLERNDFRGPGREEMGPPGRWEGPPMRPEGQPLGPNGRPIDLDGPRPLLPPGPRGPLLRGPVMSGPRPLLDGPRGPLPPLMDGPRMNGPGIEEDQRWTSFTEMGPEVSEEVVIGNKNYAIKLGDRPRVVRFFNEKIEVYADPSKRGIMIDGSLMYKFGERVKEVQIRGRTTRIFYHGKPVNLWIDGQNYEIRVDAPPRNIEINGNNHKIQIDGRDMMILIDKSEKGLFGGPPRFIYIDEDRMEIRFDPPPRHILIDGKLCELMLSMKRPCVNIQGKLHGIRFDGPPREAVINNQVFNIHTDRAVKVKVDNKLHYISLGGPCHELIIDGKWYEMKFGEPPKDINVGNRILSVHLPGKPPEVLILPEILPPMPGPQGMPMGPRMFGPEPGRPMGPGMEPMMRGPGPIGPGQRLMGPIPQGERLPFPIAPRPELRPEISQPGPFPPNLPPVSVAHSMAPPFPGPDGQPRPVIPQTVESMAPPSASVGGMPNALASLFPNIPQPRLPTAAPAQPAMDINTLLQKLIATGIIKKEPEPSTTASTTTTTTAASSGVKPVELMNVRKKVEKQESIEEIPDMTDLDIALMRELPNGVIQRLYAGIQCTTCGVRFVLDSEEKTEKYREHLDWHFRQKRRERDEMKSCRYRQWYYGVNDWLQYEEVTDTEEVARSMFFERQQQTVQQPTPATPSNMSFALITVPEGATVTRCPAATGNDSDDLCAICHEPFEQFWDEELEEWHLRDAIRVNDQTYHPICYEDHTDVSEGTPSPSALPMMPPDFSARKTLSYDETSQDTHDSANTSFEGERQVVKMEPVLKTEPKEDIGAPTDVITVSDSPVKLLNVKTEPMDTTDSAIVKQEGETVVDGKTVVPYEVTSIVKTVPVADDTKTQAEVTVPVKEEIEPIVADQKHSVDQEIASLTSASQSIPESTNNDVVMPTEAVAVTTTDTVAMAADAVVAAAMPKSVIKSSEAVTASPAPQESGGSTPVQDERSRSSTPVKDECPGTPVQDEPMVE